MRTKMDRDFENLGKEKALPVSGKGVSYPNALLGAYLQFWYVLVVKTPLDAEESTKT